MKYRPILFSGPMVRALLDGKKTQTRRVAKVGSIQSLCLVDCPYGAPGDVLWVRETWRTLEQDDGTDGLFFPADGGFAPIENTEEAADRWVAAHENGKHGNRYRPSIFLPKWAPRLFLRVESVRVERLRDISHPDALAEGCEGDERNGLTARVAFADLWRSINGAESWDANPWVWVVEFSRIERPAGWPVSP
jgi:hypothetical protein